MYRYTFQDTAAVLCNDNERDKTTSTTQFWKNIFRDGVLPRFHTSGSIYLLLSLKIFRGRSMPEILVRSSLLCRGVRRAESS